MRLYTPVPIICRLSDKEYEIQGRTLPSGIQIKAVHQADMSWQYVPEVRI